MVKQYEIYWVSLDPAIGSEINKVRPCLIISPDDSNRYLNTVLVAPITSTIKQYPTRVNIVLEKRNGQVVIDQIRSIDKLRLKGHIDTLGKKDIGKVKVIIKEYLVD